MKKHLLKLLLLCCIGMLALSIFACVPTTEQYKVNFFVEGRVYDSITTSGNSRVDLPSDPEITDRVFLGWYLDEGTWSKEFIAQSLQKDPIKEDINVYAKLELDKNHKCNKQWKPEIAATCMSEGKEVQRCTDPKCAKVYAVRTLPILTDHSKIKDLVKDVVIVTGTPASCVSGGTYTEMYYCSVCKAKLSEEPKTSEKDADAHNFAAKSQLIKVDGGFNFVAKCSDCGFTHTLKNVYAAENIEVAATCEGNGKRNYKFSYAGLDFFTADETILATGHILCGIEIDKNKTYSEITHSNLFSKITWIADTKFENSACGDPVQGIFTCEACSTSVKINANKPHVGVWEKIADATCYKAGEEVLDLCSACKQTDLTRQILATGNHKDGEIILVKDGGAFHLAIACINRDSKNPDNGCQYLEIMVRDVEISKQEKIISKNCQIPDVIRYTCKTPNGTYTYDEVISTGHFINGVRADTLTDENGWFNYNYVGKGLELFADTELNCGSQTNGRYTCEYCKQLVLVVIDRPHTGEWKITTAPTCTTAGVENFYCNNCTYGHITAVTRVVDPVPHKYDYKLSIDANNKFCLTGKCISCDEVNTINNVTAVFNVEKEATCKEEGLIRYTCYYEGGVYDDITEKIPVIAHTLGGELVGNRLEYSKYVATNMVEITAKFLWCVDSPEDTTNDVDGTYTCEECGDKINVKVYRVHAGETTKSYAQKGDSPCEVTVTEIFDCGYLACDHISKKEYDEVNHNYVLSIKNEGDGTYTVTKECNVVGCDSKFLYTGITDVTQKVIVQPTCSAMGSIEYKFTHNGEEITVVATVDRGNHILNGVDYETLYVDGKLPDNIEYIVVGAEKFFKCEECGHLVNAVKP